MKRRPRRRRAQRRPRGRAGTDGFLRARPRPPPRPLWRVLHGLVTDRPAPRCVPAMWRYAEIRPYLMEACKLISAAKPSAASWCWKTRPAGESRITQSLFAGLQIILPGEIAPAHKHTASALRFIIEGTKLHRGRGRAHHDGARRFCDHAVHDLARPWQRRRRADDLARRPGHAHRQPAVRELSRWLSGKVHPLDRPEGAAMAEAGHNLLPVDQVYGSQTSPIFNYPYRSTREALDQLARFRAADAWHAYKMKYINPVNGGWAMPPFPHGCNSSQGFKTAPYRSTDSAVFTVVEGTGRARSARKPSTGDRTTSSSRRAGSRTSTVHRATR